MQYSKEGEEDSHNSEVLLGATTNRLDALNKLKLLQFYISLCANASLQDATTQQPVGAMVQPCCYYGEERVDSQPCVGSRWTVRPREPSQRQCSRRNGLEKWFIPVYTQDTHSTACTSYHVTAQHSTHIVSQHSVVWFRQLNIRQQPCVN